MLMYLQQGVWGVVWCLRVLVGKAI